MIVIKMPRLILPAPKKIDLVKPLPPWPKPPEHGGKPWR